MLPTINILLIEDNPGDVLLMEELLGDSAGFSANVSVAETLKGGMELLNKNRFDIILLDLGLPDSQGLDAVEKVLQIVSHIPIVVITGLDDDVTGRKAIEMGAQSYVIKGLMNQRAITEAISYGIERNKILLEIRAKEAELENSNQLLQKANNEKERLIALLSHDLRGPVKTVVSFLELMRERFDEFSEERKKQILDNCIKSGNLAVDLMETMLDWARSQANERKVNPESIPLQPFVNKLLEPLRQGALEKSISLVNNTSEESSFYADSDMIATVVRNLVSNAIKFTPGNGEVTISDESVPDQKIRLSVQDTGVGIAEEDLSKLFDISEGFTTRGTNNERGTGFGLILCKDFVEKNKGRLEVESEKGKGTRVSIVLPTSK